MRIQYNKYPFILSVVIITSFLLSGICFAGAWAMQKGKLYDRLAVNYYLAEKEFDKENSKKDFAANGEFRDLNLNNYIEYGLSDRVTLINSLYFKHIQRKDDLQEKKTYGIGDIDAGVKVKLFEGSPGVFSAQMLAKIPAAYDKNDPLPLGNGQYDLEARILYGRSLWPLPGYCNFEIGYRWRFEDPSDELRYLAEAGVDFSKSFYGRVKLDGTYSMDNGSRFDSGGNPATTNNFDLGKLDVTLGYRISRAWGLELGYNPAVFGQNTAAGATYTMALTYQMP
jgi:hypothetical protein